MSNEQFVKLELNLNQVNVILAALAKQPLEVVLEVFNSIQKQANNQLSQTQDPLTDKPV